MADNVTIPLTGSGDATAIVATDEVGGAQHQYVKLEFGADGTATKVSSSDPLPVTVAGPLGQALAAASLPVVLTAAQITTLTPPAAISGFGTAANQTTIIGHVDGIEALLAAIYADTSALAGAVAGTEMQVDIVAALPSGTNNIGDVDVLSLPGVAGDIAHDGADSGSPLKIGAKAVAHGTNPTAVAAADRTDLYANRHGVLFVMGGHPNIQTLRTNYTAAQTDATLVTVSGGTKIVVTKVSVLADKANTVDVQVRIGFGATTTPTGAGVVLTHPGIAAGSGVIEGAGGSILGVGADGEDLRITSEVPTTGSIDVLVTYYTIES